MDLQEVECEGMDWIDVSQYRARWQTLVNVVANNQVPQDVRNVLTSWGPCWLLRKDLLHGLSQLDDYQEIPILPIQLVQGSFPQG
jgi:hypothetical protein